MKNVTHSFFVFFSFLSFLMAIKSHYTFDEFLVKVKI